MWETWVQSLGWEDLLEKEMATHSSTLVWKIPWTEGPGRLQSMGSQRIGHDWATSLSLSYLQRNFISWGQFPRGYLGLWCSISENLHQEISAYLFISFLFMSSNILQVLRIFPPLNWPEIVSLIEINPTSLIRCWFLLLQVCPFTWTEKHLFKVCIHILFVL